MIGSLRSRLRKLLRRALRHVEGELHAHPALAAKVLPIRQGPHGYVLPPPAGWGETLPEDDGLAIPPPALWLGYADTPHEFLETGRRDTSAMLDILRAGGANPERMRNVLDLGCAAGRMLRFFPAGAPDGQRWGLDISATHIAWCQAHLDPPFRFATISTIPHLPFPDGFFDLVYCASVFTHIAELPDAWLLEILRVVRPDGYAYVTIHDESTVRWLLEEHADREGWSPIRQALRAFHHRTRVLDRPYATFSIGHGPDAQVFYDSGALARRWGRLAEVVSITPGAHDHQTAVLLRQTGGS